MTRKDLCGKTAVITGGSSGIGKETLLEFAKLGMNIVVGSLATELLTEVEAELKLKGVKLMVITTDVSKRDQVQRLVKTAVEHYGHIDYLVCCAGVYHRGPVEKLALHELERVMSVNFYGVIHCIYEMLPVMIKQGNGHMVFISSVDGKKGLPRDSAYVASKFAVAGFVDVLRQEVKKFGIRVSTIFPARIDTPMLHNIQVPAISPKVPAQKVTQAIVHAILHNKAETLVPCSGAKLLLFFHLISPRFADWMIKITHLEGWDT
jgi:NAD(P)-dependent dehydrogenase (short-subunit alcohol dehydrogenase family)